jgi:hypothetical protein
MRPVVAGNGHADAIFGQGETVTFHTAESKAEAPKAGD